MALKNNTSKFSELVAMHVTLCKQKYSTITQTVKSQWIPQPSVHAYVLVYMCVYACVVPNRNNNKGGGKKYFN